MVQWSQALSHPSPAATLRGAGRGTALVASGGGKAEKSMGKAGEIYGKSWETMRNPWEKPGKWWKSLWNTGNPWGMEKWKVFDAKQKHYRGRVDWQIGMCLVSDWYLIGIWYVWVFANLHQFTTFIQIFVPPNAASNPADWQGKGNLNRGIQKKSFARPSHW